ncbi:unnamed protein product [Dibothriocephalus latus]|uniref:PDZ domain-containing protein n=1 Tax=Dibothriocephalus latus TaxID=60516 RepID=A0A3P7L5U7_DIBLA|nr:unnamed protein product [Dibothriocephalus latus]
MIPSVSAYPAEIKLIRTVTFSRNFESTPKKIVRHSYDFPTKRILLMRNSKDRQAGGNGFGIKITGGRKRIDGRLGSFVDQVISGETLNYLHGEISEGDEIIEWNGTVLIDKEASEVQAIINTPADEAELLLTRGTTSELTGRVKRTGQHGVLAAIDQKRAVKIGRHEYSMPDQRIEDESARWHWVRTTSESTLAQKDLLEGLKVATTIIATDEDIKEGQLVVLFLLHRELDFRHR